jgi:hypothetical protein
MLRAYRRVFRVTALAAIALLSGCGGSSTGPGQAPEFPTLEAQLLADWCIRGNLSVGTNGSEVLSEVDCDNADTGDLDTLVGFPGHSARFETWRLRVTAQTNLRITVSSNFDSFLDLYRIPDPTDPTGGANIASNDDLQPGVNDDARLIVTVSPDFEYWIMVSGYDEAELGAYTLTVGRL